MAQKKVWYGSQRRAKETVVEHVSFEHLTKATLVTTIERLISTHFLISRSQEAHL